MSIDSEHVRLLESQIESLCRCKVAALGEGIALGLERAAKIAEGPIVMHVSCPDNKPGCCVVHYGTRYSSDGDLIAKAIRAKIGRGT